VSTPFHPHRRAARHWPAWRYNAAVLSSRLSDVSRAHGNLLGRMIDVSPALRNRANLEALTGNVLAIGAIGGEILKREAVRASLIRRLGVEASGVVTDDRAEALVAMVLDATVHRSDALTVERLWTWHAALFSGRIAGTARVHIGRWRDDSVCTQMPRFLAWANEEVGDPLLIKAGVAHLWLLALKPFDDGNRRIATSVSDLFLSRADGISLRFYSLSAQIACEFHDYHDVLQRIRKGLLDVTDWLVWFLDALGRAFAGAHVALDKVLFKTRWAQRWAGTPMNARQAAVISRLLEGDEGRLTRRKWAALAACGPDTALRDISELLTLGMLRKLPEGGCTTAYELAQLTD